VNDRELAGAMRVLREVFGEVTVIADYVVPDRPTVIDHCAIASGKRRSSLTVYRDAQVAVRRTP
jgi:azurin